MMALTDRVTAVSLFSGLGGMDIGLHRAGIETVVMVEKDPDAARTLKANTTEHPDVNPPPGLPSRQYSWRVIEDDLHDIESHEILDAAGESDIDLVVGGPPCQTFSRSNEGEREGTGDDRGRLFEQFARVVQDLEPAGFIFENVRGLKSSNGGKDLEQILEALSGEAVSETSGGSRSPVEYKTNHTVLNAADFGVPQARKRLIIIGAREGDPPNFPDPTHPDDHPAAEKELENLAIDSDLVGSNGYRNAIGGEHGHLLREIPSGANYQHFSDRKYVDGEYVERTDAEKKKKEFDWRSRHWNYLLKQDPKRPAWTIQAKPGTYVGPFHWHSRRFSHLEQMLLQDLPKDYYVAGDHRSVQRQIGNAVPPGLAAAVGECLVEQIHGEVPISSNASSRVSATDGGKEVDDSEVRITGRTSPWEIAARVVSALHDESSVTVSGQGRRVSAAICVAQIVDLVTQRPVEFEFEEGQRSLEQSASDVVSDLSVTITPD